MKKTEIIVSIIAGVLLFGFLFAVYYFTNQDQLKIITEINRVKTTDHIRWSGEKKNLLIEYSDFQCPACKNFHSFLQQIEATTSSKIGIPQKVTLIFRHFPLFQTHPSSMDAAYAAEAADKQGKFWEMADYLFNNQTDWTARTDVKQYFVNVAGKLGLNTEKFVKDMASDEVRNHVQTDLDQGNKAGIDATPTFFLNGKKVDVQTFAEFKQLLESL